MHTADDVAVDRGSTARGEGADGFDPAFPGDVGLIAPPADAARRIGFILHWGCVLIRNMAYGEGPHLPIADLADALEILPRYLPEPTAEDWRMVRFVVTNYNRLHPDHGWRLVRALDEEAPDHY